MGGKCAVEDFSTLKTSPLWNHLWDLPAHSSTFFIFISKSIGQTAMCPQLPGWYKDSYTRMDSYA